MQGYPNYQYPSQPQSQHPYPQQLNPNQNPAFVAYYTNTTPFIPTRADVTHNPNPVIPNISHLKSSRRPSNSSTPANGNGASTDTTNPTGTGRRSKKSTSTAPERTDSTTAPRPRTHSISKRDTFPTIPGMNGVPELLQASNPDFRALHMFMSIRSNNELCLENLPKVAVDELRTTILGMWPYGIDKDEHSGYDWTVKFRNAPWSAAGDDRITAWNMIVEMFTLFARRGFAFQTSVNTASPPPRLIFAVNPPDMKSHFVLGYFSQGGHRFTLFNAPTQLELALKVTLSSVLPRKIVPDRVIHERFCVVEVKQRRLFGPPVVRPAVFMMHVLKIMSELGFNLDAAVPLMGSRLFRQRRELLVFKSTVTIPERER